MSYHQSGGKFCTDKKSGPKKTLFAFIYRDSKAGH